MMRTKGRTNGQAVWACHGHQQERRQVAPK